MKNFILEKLKNYKELSSDMIMSLCDDYYYNSPFKLNLLKDKQKNAKVSDKKFYLSNGDFVVKFQYDDICERLDIFPSKDIVNFEQILKTLKGLMVSKINIYINSGFNNLQQELSTNYSVELVRKDRFLNDNKYEDEIVFSKLDEGR